MTNTKEKQIIAEHNKEAEKACTEQRERIDDNDFDINKLDEYFKNIPVIDKDYYEYNHIW